MHDFKATKKPATAPLTKDQLLGVATDLMKHGFSLLPIKMAVAGNARSGKVPACRNGVNDATKDPRQFKKLVESLPKFNLGIATGKVSNVIVHHCPRY